MVNGQKPAGLELSEEEAYGLLAMCLTSPQGIDGTSEAAIRKLASYCIELSNRTHSVEGTGERIGEHELEKAGA
jgi:hypothetical protein